MDTLKRNSAKGYKDDEGIGTSLWEGCEMGPFSPGKRRLWGRILLVCINTWREGDKEDRAKIFSVVPSYGTKLKHRRFLPKIRKHFSVLRLTEHWCRLFREIMEFPIFEDIQKAPGHSSVWSCLGRGWVDKASFRVLCNPNHSVI